MERASLSRTGYKNKHWICAALLIAFGIFIRLVAFGTCPDGLNHDEAFAGYEAFSLLHYAVDSAGYQNPCYFVAWGSGMNVLESYLAIPFMKLFGCSVITLRLPQLLCACISLFVFYLLLKKIFSAKTALLGLGLLTISPWHIMLSRWGLESNLAPAFLLFGFYFFIRGLENNRYWILSAVMYGLSLYSYAITWFIVPVTILFNGIYLSVSKQKVSFQYVMRSFMILCLFALPLILFVFVNYGFLPEISTRYLSIPKLLSMRDAEISMGNLFSASSYNNFFNVFIKQDDGMLWNSTADFGLYYKWSLPFLLLGGVKLSMVAWKKVRRKIFCCETMILFGILWSVVVCLLISNLNVNKANSLHFYMLILLTIGIREIFMLCKRHAIIPKTLLCCYAVSFAFFLSFYFSSYNKQISYLFRAGTEDAVAYVKEQEFSDVCVDSEIYYPQILFFDQTPQPVFADTVKYANYPSAHVHVEKFGRYSFGIDYDDLNSHEAYIIKQEQCDLFADAGFETVRFDHFSVAYRSSS